MASADTAKDATGPGERPSNCEQLAGRLDLTDSKFTQRLQVARLVRRHAISVSSAHALAPLVFGEVA
jgi:hypothetical protein